MQVRCLHTQSESENGATLLQWLSVLSALALVIVRLLQALPILIAFILSIMHIKLQRVTMRRSLTIGQCYPCSLAGNILLILALLDRHSSLVPCTGVGVEVDDSFRVLKVHFHVA
jgi:hypothetical protein